MDALLPRTRALIATMDGGLEGWMDEDAAASATQLFGRGPSGLLVIDHRELLTSTARVVGAELGEMHFKAWMALITLHVAHGMPADGKGESSVADFARLIWGKQERGGRNTRLLLSALFDLRNATFTVPGYDLVNQRKTAGVSDTNLLINLVVDETLLRSYQSSASGERRPVDRVEIGRAMGGRQHGTLGWRLHPDYTQRLRDADLRRFDWTKAQKLRGSALGLWLLFTSPRVPYRTVFDDPGLESVEVELTVEHCHSLGVRASADAARRRTLNDAGARVVEVDQSFVAFEAHGGRNRPSYLRVVRQSGLASPLDRPQQLVLEAV